MDAHLLFMLGEPAERTSNGYAANVASVAFEIDTRLWSHFNDLAIRIAESAHEYVLDTLGVLERRDTSGVILWRADSALTGTPAAGPDGNAYLLHNSTLRIYRLEDGHLVGEAAVSESPTVIVSGDGYVALVDPLDVLTGVAKSSRVEFDPGDAETAAGEEREPADIVSEATLYNFWASWCAPCREEMPELVALTDSVDGMRLVTMNDDVNPAHATFFLRDVSLSPLVWYGFGKFRNSYGYAGLPTTVLVDGDGREVFRWTGFGGESQLNSIRALTHLLLN